MQSSKNLFDNLLQQITAYETQEAKEIVFWLLEFYLGLKKIDIISDKSFEKVIDWNSIVERLNTQEPIQYILGETEFYGRRFFVNDSVLIPRPETEELVKFVVDKQQNLLSESNNTPKLLDIGTGSGCIAISLAKELPNYQVSAYDISERALETATKNAELNQANVDFQKVDILSYKTSTIEFPKFNIIVSNPPYVTRQEIRQMRENVLDFEPHLALFVEDTDPLIFYEVIADFACENLTNNGLVAVEINETLGTETAEVFLKKGFSEVEIIKDIHQKDRFVSAILHKKEAE
ncbi:protein-(glutamine-N5) methyltransferase, release factor-specific [Emticicia oligotrophica DSM 17448]|uniref:Release factor glutamine methyltransferase n=1 Tax=Emticicia oligotrophica (strain DSM 17448 / CIP 109782 / MTCC 6937 / GPTSA100-15) TaxID=929562 RepID=A0ABM5N2D0_EMTOG|nr:peptide chain release factor N(5)-glutamine methyltransferase [Emticicia oligotrophica]AFK03618.1 protein-(glutamine-N5) methyltransferase, release factor-specific [Emticicia oligotrophica DSM 17448]